MDNPLSLALLIAGVILLIFGLNAGGSFASETKEALTGTPTDKSMWLIVLGAIGILIAGAEPLSKVDFGTLPPQFWWLAAYAIVFATVLAYFLNYYALRHTDSSMVALFIYMQPPIATALSMIFLGERPGPRFWIAAAGVFVGVFLSVRDRARG